MTKETSHTVRLIGREMKYLHTAAVNCLRRSNPMRDQALVQGQVYLELLRECLQWELATKDLPGGDTAQEALLQELQQIIHPESD